MCLPLVFPLLTFWIFVFVKGIYIWKTVFSSNTVVATWLSFLLFSGCFSSTFPLLYPKPILWVYSLISINYSSLYGPEIKSGDHGYLFSIMFLRNTHSHILNPFVTHLYLFIEITQIILLIELTYIHNDLACSDSSFFFFLNFFLLWGPVNTEGVKSLVYNYITH